MVFARSCYGGPLLGVVLAVARKCEPPSFDVCLPYNAGISGGFSGCFSGFFLVGFGLFGPGAARAPVYILVRSGRKIYRYIFIIILKGLYCFSYLYLSITLYYFKGVINREIYLRYLPIYIFTRA